MTTTPMDRHGHDLPDGTAAKTVFSPTFDDNPLGLALFGLDRQDSLPWVTTVWDRPVLDIGPGVKLIPGADRLDFPDYDFDAYRHSDGVLRLGWQGILPYKDNSVGGIYAINILEHLWEPRPFIAECARVLHPGCPMNIVVPHALAGVYLQDLDHKKAFILDTWNNFLNNPYYDKGHIPVPLEVGANFKFAIKEENVNIMTQLIKVER